MHSCDFVAVSIVNLQFFVRVFSKTLTVNCVVFFKEVIANSLREKCPNTEFFLVRIFPHLD